MGLVDLAPYMPSHQQYPEKLFLNTTHSNKWNSKNSVRMRQPSQVAENCAEKVLNMRGTIIEHLCEIPCEFYMYNWLELDFRRMRSLLRVAVEITALLTLILYLSRHPIDRTMKRCSLGIREDGLFTLQGEFSNALIASHKRIIL